MCSKIMSYRNGHSEVVQYLEEIGADKDPPHHTGALPVFVGSGNGHLEVVKCLVERGADKHKPRHDGGSPLYGLRSKTAPPTCRPHEGLQQTQHLKPASP